MFTSAVDGNVFKLLLVYVIAVVYIYVKKDFLCIFIERSFHTLHDSEIHYNRDNFI